MLRPGHIIVYGFLTYAAVYMLWALMFSYGVASAAAFGYAPRILNYAAVVVAVAAASRHIGVPTWREAILFGVGLAGMHIFLDIVYITPAAGFEALLAPPMWINYALVFFTPFGVFLHNRA